MLTVQGLDWAGVKNGELLSRSVGAIDAFITMDSNLLFQQRLEGLPFGVVIIHATSNRLAALLPMMDPVSATLSELTPGQVRHVGA